ncbi:putative molibdopterin-dependent oxidoreductase YjgC [Pseudochelatococcus lubricantis]|uniref:Molibdopterin-dependent oxidoreductase YjgC n=1 Tax=Pseudochelatococcus lubricantis TaxID=1538102 RepID=A0ABX0V6K0_9HYPH|nr:(2Fe-2S)-binding protein [Pseudochelatococcus lubricantis]NIJ59724.1 putative molibdopterin-dependent oxidoreductase YjgC [Pseudochelatococcus lubricantis]
MQARFRRLAEKERRAVVLTVDGEAVRALEGDVLLTALMLSRGFARMSEFGDGPRAGFCMMGACQDCWVWTGAGERLRACSTSVAEGMDIRTHVPEGIWPIPA